MLYWIRSGGRQRKLNYGSINTKRSSTTNDYIFPQFKYMLGTILLRVAEKEFKADNGKTTKLYTPAMHEIYQANEP